MIQLRDYQNDLVRQLYQAVRQNLRKVICCAPTGSGKRIVACWLATQIIERQRRLLVVTDRRILVKQMGAECREHGIPYGLIMGDEPTNHEAPVQIASIQTLSTRDWTDCPSADWIIVDECHKAPDAYKRLFEHYKPFNPVICGFTATPVNADGRMIAGWDAVIEPVTNSQLIRSGHLLKTIVLAPFEPDVKGILSKGDLSADVANRIKNCIVFADVFKHFQQYDTRQFIVFCPGVAFANGMAEEFAGRGYTCEVICAATTQRDRDSMFERYRDGSLQGLVSVDVLREGFDAPEAQVGIDIQPNYQIRTFWQKVGRVKRPHEGQDSAVWLDFAGNFWRHLHPDEDPEWPTDGDTTTRDLVEKRREREAANTKEPWSCPSCAYQLSTWERMRDGKCPNCGLEMKPAKRRIRFEDGTMKAVSPRQKKKTQTDDKVKLWFSCLYPVWHSGKPLNMARVFYKSKCGEWPNHEVLPKCPEPSAPEWRRRAKDVYPELVRR